MWYLKKFGLILTPLILTLTVIVIAMAQPKFSYPAAWKKVDEALKKAQPKTALAEIEKIIVQSKKDKQDAQYIKGIIYKAKTVQMVEEDSWLKNLQFFEAEIVIAKEPAKQLLYSITAGLYKSYFEQQRWKIYNRTKTNDAHPKKPETWSVADFNERISSYYEKSLANAALLQKTSLVAFAPILVEGNTRHLRPTLFDLLAHEALGFWKSEESEITKPVYAFVPDYAALAPAKVFLRQQYASPDSTSNTFKAIRLYQALLAFHIKDEKPDALIDLDVARINYAFEKAVMPEKNQLYKEALEHIFTQYGQNEQAMQAGFLLAKWWQEKGDAYHPATGTQTDKMAYAISLQIAEKIVKTFPKSEGGIWAKQVIAEIKRPVIGLAIEKVNVINKPVKALLRFKNTGIVYFRIVKLPAALQEEDRNFEDDATYWSRVTAQQPLRSWQQRIPVTNDYRSHSVEIKIDALPNGRYLVIASADEKFIMDKNPLASAELLVSNISYVQTGEHFFVLNRDNGQPVEGAKVQVWYTHYDYNKRRNIFSRGELFTTDKNGYFHAGKVNRNNTLGNDMRLEITSPNDYLFMADALYRTFDGGAGPNKSAAQYELDNARYYFFTDRSIYRPGQTLYFKAIGLTKKAADGKPALFNNGNVEVILKNANYEKVSSQTFTPNAYAGINGTFLLPAGGLTGAFTLEIKVANRSWSHSFRVEEYKRPRFFVTYQPVKGAYKLNQEISITGMAKGYAGNNIDGAQVSYRVKRATRYLYPWHLEFRRGGYWTPEIRGNETEITNGTTQTKADGSFDIRFSALPDNSVDPGVDPAFDYTIEAVVTDINGEVRSAETTVSVGYKSLILELDAGKSDMHAADSTLEIRVSAANLNGLALKSNVRIVVYALQSPGKLLRSRYWEQPDTFILSRNEFEKYFPNDPYKNEDDFRNWKSAREVLSTTLSTPDKAVYHIKPGTLLPGYYKIEAITQDEEGKEVKNITFIGVFDHRKGILATPAYLTAYAQKTNAEPGEQAVYWQGSSVTDAYVIQQTIKKGSDGLAGTHSDRVSFAFLQPGSGYQRYAFDATEDDRGGYAINRIMVYHNRVYTQQWMVQVPWSNKDLSIQLETFRDKLQPGDKEKWTVKISGAKGELAAAEMLAGMYDASLDQFEPHNWEVVNPWTNNYFNVRWNSGSNFSEEDGREFLVYEHLEGFRKQYDRLMQATNDNDMVLSGRIMGLATLRDGMVREDSYTLEVPPPPPNSPAMAAKGNFNQAEKILSAKVAAIATDSPDKIEEKSGGKIPTVEFAGIDIRKNFNETAFFFPELSTDAMGNISFSFTMPEALTSWKLQLMAHTADARFAYATQTVVTQKQLMVIPNTPRFFRQGDNLELGAKIVNLTNKEVTGQARLQLLNAATLQPVDGWFRNVFPSQYFTAAPGQSVPLQFPVEIPYLYNDAVVYRIVAQTATDSAGSNFSDGEENMLPVISNRMLVTESFPLFLRGDESKTFSWERFKSLSEEATGGEGLQHHRITVEYTTNPVWYAVQSLPYLMEYPYDCTEQTWNRFYANALAGKIIGKTPGIKKVFASWKNSTPDALLSNLQKNEELKSVLLEETPWVLDAQNETEQKRNVALLFDLVRMEKEAESAMQKLREMQSSNGGFVWFKGGPDDRYMTQYLLTGIGKLRTLDAIPEQQRGAVTEMVKKAIPYADKRIKEEYELLVKAKTNLKEHMPSAFALHYLYMRSFFTNYAIPAVSQKAIEYFMQQAVAKWPAMAKTNQGMTAIALFRKGMTKEAATIMESLSQNSITHEEFGMYWKEFNNPGRYWWQAPIESHALLMEAFAEIRPDQKRMDALKLWLLQQKQTTNWKTTKATADACYALLMRGTDWLSTEKTVQIQLGNLRFGSGQGAAAEEGTGYFKQVITPDKINSSLGNIQVQTQSKPQNNSTAGSPSWGAVYWQYFQDLDKITSAETSVSIKKQLYRQVNTDRGPVLEKVEDGGAIKTGDRIKVRLEIKTDRNMEYVHLKDMRASCFEPVQVLSGYRMQGGLGYYESTRDAGTHFFIGYLPRGTYVFEYEMRATMKGNFSNGITTLQCMYAPAFSSHSNGIRVNVGN